MTTPPPPGPYPAAGPHGGYAVPPDAAGRPPGSHPGQPHHQQPYHHRPYHPPPTAPNGQALADFGQRLLAYLLDALIVGVAGAIVTVPLFLWWTFTVIERMDELFGPPGSVAEPTGGEVFSAIFLPMLVMLLIVFAVQAIATYVYQVEMMFRSGQTIGKRIMKLRVVPLEPGARLTRSEAAKRWLIQWGVGTFVPGFSYLDGFWQLWDKPYRQCLHDKVPRTVVVKIFG